METPRYTDHPFPSYAFVPGEHPHPTRDPRGHSYSTEPEPPVPSVAPEDWRESPDYLYGADCYNHGYLWEAHEAWEGLWHVSKHDPVQAEFIQGLIQCAAGCLKITMKQPRGVTKLTEQGIGRLLGVVRIVGPEYMGVDIPEFTNAITEFVASSPESADGRPRLVLE